jgi:hypothetical protein
VKGKKIDAAVQREQKIGADDDGYIYVCEYIYVYE